MLPGEVKVSEHVVRGVLRELGHLRELHPQHPGHVVELAHGRGVIGLSEDRADDRGHDVLDLLGTTASRFRIKCALQTPTVNCVVTSLIGIG